MYLLVPQTPLSPSGRNENFNNFLFSFVISFWLKANQDKDKRTVTEPEINFFKYASI